MNCNGLTYGFVWKGTLVYIIIIIIIIIISSSSSSSSSSSIILGISFMQGIYTYIPEKKHVPKEHRVAATPVLLFMVRISLVPTLTLLYLLLLLLLMVVVVIEVVVVVVVLCMQD